MTSFDTNILLYAFSRASPFHDRARVFLEDLTPHDDVAVSELVLVEFYALLRNPAVLLRPLVSAAAVEVVQSYRRHPRWMLVGFDPDSTVLHDELWRLAAKARFGRRRIYDAPGPVVAETGRHGIRHRQREGLQRPWLRSGLEPGGVTGQTLVHPECTACALNSPPPSPSNRSASLPVARDMCYTS